MLTKVIATTLTVSALSATTALVALSVANRAIVEEVPFGKEIRCFFGLGEDCIREKLIAARAELDALNEEWERRQKKLGALQDPEAVREHEPAGNGWYVVVSSFYDIPVRRIGHQFSVCHMARDMGGPDDDLLIAEMESGPAELTAPDLKRLDQLNLTFSAVEAAAKACPWPS
ncbi:hypothetical protein [Roseobacter sp. S98]|uniref:hypothetical protein n=1 Tax=Roseobacter algicola (ex Choi et al. 2025) (nom. illeg.) TaxID=3092138 RepID=UPI003F51698E